jgi:hypothetical protein
MRPLSAATSSIVLNGCSRPGRHSSMRLPTPRIDNDFVPGASSANAARCWPSDFPGPNGKSNFHRTSSSWLRIHLSDRFLTNCRGIFDP